MRKIQILIAAMLISGCGKVTKPFIVTSKAYQNANYVPIPPMMCYYTYNEAVMFQDSCTKYNVGDTIK